MLEFYYDFLDYYLSREDFQILEMDTDSNCLRIAAENMEDLIKPELREQFEREKHNWFVTPLAPQGKRTLGLFKVEFKGDKMIGLCSKSYCTENFATDTTPGQVKVSMKGVNKGQFKNPMSAYEHVLNTKKILEPVTLEFVPRIRQWLHTNSTRMLSLIFTRGGKCWKMDVRLYH